MEKQREEENRLLSRALDEGASTRTIMQLGQRLNRQRASDLGSIKPRE
jgi:hypothetical protein